MRKLEREQPPHIRAYGVKGGRVGREASGASICRPHLRQGRRIWNLGQDRLCCFDPLRECVFLSLSLHCDRKCSFFLSFEDAIQQRAAYFGYTAAPGGSCAARAPAELPSFSSAESSAPPRWTRATIGVSGWRKSSEDSMQEAQLGPQILRRSVAVADRRDHEGLPRTLVSMILVARVPASKLDSMHTHHNLSSFWPGREERVVETHVCHQAYRTSSRS